jgi:redox-regulated HSP33 family molecular chaperone
MAAASLMASFLKGEERVTVSLHFSKGKLESVVGQGVKLGDVRGHLQYAPEDLSPELRTDNVTVSQVLYNKAKPITSVSPLAVSSLFFPSSSSSSSFFVYFCSTFSYHFTLLYEQKGDVSSDIQNYFNQSEQNRTITHLETLFDERKGKVEFSGGFFLQPFPFHDDCLELLEAGRSRVSNLGLVNEVEMGRGGVTLLSLLEKFGMNRVANLILLGEDERGEAVNQSQQRQNPKVREDTTISPVRFQCHCSLDAFKSQLLNLGKGTLMEMEQQGQNSMVCHYCSTEYKLTPKDFEELQTQLRSLEIQPKK